MIPHLWLRPYQLPLRCPWRTAHGVRTRRVGWLVCAESDGVTGYGDCAPLPEAGTEAFEAARGRLERWCGWAGGQDLQAQLDALAAASLGSARLGASASAAQSTACQWRPIKLTTPSADAAWETALLDLEARRNGLPLWAHLLQRGSGERGDLTAFRDERVPPNLPPARDKLRRIQLNAALGAVMTLDQAALDHALARGFRVLKLKVGVAPWNDEVEAIARLCDRLPEGVRLRLDANQAWGIEAAHRFVDALQPVRQRIESLEEPLRPGASPSAGAEESLLTRHGAAMRALQESTGFSIALDESVPTSSPLSDLTRLPVRRLVLKPAVLGGLRPTLALARAAQSAGVEVVVTSLIESAAGVWASAQLAAATGSPLAHGLATSDWLAADLGTAPHAESGQLRIPAIAGSGFEPWTLNGA